MREAPNVKTFPTTLHVEQTPGGFKLLDAQSAATAAVRNF
jgi:hypothetical protein